MTDEGDASPLEGAAELPARPSKKPKKEKKAFDPLSDEPIKFKTIDFEHALTADEKAAKKAAKIAEKKAQEKAAKNANKKPKQQKSIQTTEPSTVTEETETKVSKSSKKGKKIDQAEEDTKAEEETKLKTKKGKKEPKEDDGEKGKKSKKDVKDGEGNKEDNSEKGKKRKKDVKEGEKLNEDVSEKSKKSKKDVKEGNGEKGKKEGEKPSKMKTGKEPPKSEPELEYLLKPEKGKGKGKEKGKGKKKKEKEEEEEVQEWEEEEEEEEYDFREDLWTWESYSVSFDELVEKPKQKKPESEEKKPKKEKKEKKGKKAKEPKVEEVPDELSELAKIKQLAAATLTAMLADQEKPLEETSESEKGKKGKGKKKKKVEDEVTEEVPKEKGKKGKKLSKKEKAALAAEMAKQAQMQAEIEAKLAAEAERVRLIEERKANIEKEKRETIEQKLRVEQLANSLHLFHTVKEKYKKKAIEDKKINEWNRYLKCDGLPNPYHCGDMNTYLYQWDQVMDQITLEQALVRTNDVLQLLSALDLLIDEPLNVGETTIANLKWVHVLFREHQQKSLDTASYRMLRDVQRNLNRLNIKKADYTQEDKNLVFCLWVMVQMPIAMPNPRKPALPQIILKFPKMSMEVTFPIKINCDCMAIRTMYLRYDHLSSLCSSFDPPPVPREHTNDLNSFNIEEWRSKLFYKYESYRKGFDEGSPVGETGEDEVERLPPIDRTTVDIPTVPYRKLEVTASQYMFEEEDQMYQRIRDGLRTYVEDNVVNLRKYCVLGGTFYLDLYYQPPQPKDMVSFIMTVTRLEIPICLAEIPFYETYVPPLPTDSNVMLEPEQIDEEMKYIEEQLNKLVYITLTLPAHILWLDTPIICQWDREKQLWSQADIHDFKHIEEKNYVTFRTGRFGCFGIAVNRYINLPYQAWEIKPEENGTVTFQITAAILLIEFNIKGNLVCLADLQNGPTDALQELVGQYHTLPKLIRLLKEGGVDIFPAFDAFCYIEGTCEKQWQMVSHLYNCMAQLSVCYNFMWSRWNQAANRRTVVMQMREYNPKRTKQVPFSTLLVTPFKAILIDCTEISSEFTEVPVEGMLFYADLLHLMKGISSMPIKTKVFNAPGALVSTVAKLLIATRVLSFSS